MDKFLIRGPCKIKGQVFISGSKNAALPILAATLLFDKPVIIENLPRVRDIDTMLNLLKSLGSKIQFSKNKKTVKISKNKKQKIYASYSLVKTMRAGILVLGPLLAKFKKAHCSLPGGCNLGLRPIDADYQMYDNTKISSTIDWEPTITVKHMLLDLLNYWRNQIKNGNIPLNR